MQLFYKFTFTTYTYFDLASTSRLCCSSKITCSAIKLAGIKLGPFLLYLWLWKVMGRSRTSKSLQCSVCGDYASVHKHYGSQTHVCFSCRAFFRRVNKVKKYPESTLCNSFLTQVGSCPITKRTRAHCRSVLKMIFVPLYLHIVQLFGAMASYK